ncbi:MAG: DNA topoisomerase IV subunit B [Chloroflexi bacterium]|nr:DNA topoisomerase IV subunit B [Chloroflexota bacterium]
MVARPTQYSAEQIVELEFLEAVRRRPGMYIGNNSMHGLHHILLEVLDNAVDECMGGFASRIIVVLEPDGTASVDDDGRGIPIEWKEDAGMSALTQVMVRPHAGGKFGGEDSAYSASGGLHGIGLKCTNAFSEFVEVTVRRHGLRFRQRFEHGGIPATPVEIVDATGQVVGQIDERTSLVTERNKAALATHLRVGRQKIEVQADASLGTGTDVRFRPNRAWFAREMDWPDHESFVPWDAERLSTRFRQVTYLYPGVRIEFSDRRGDRPHQETFHSGKGLADYIAYLAEDLEPLHDPILFEETTEVESDNATEGRAEVKVEVAMQYAGEDTQIVSFVNGIPTPLGGTHVTAYKAGLTRALKEFAADKKLIKSTDAFRGDDSLLGLTAIIKITMSATPQFLSQTKECLNSPEVNGPVLSATYNRLLAYMNKNGNVGIGRSIVNQALAAARGREAAAQARKLVIKKSAMDAGEFVLGKLADIQRRGGSPLVPLEHTTLYLVEGDSAGGSCKLARDSRYHAILPLRGKIPNVEKGSLNNLLKNREIASIVAAVGAGVGQDFDLEAMRYGRVAVLADADVDGGHIATLLATLFWRLMRPMIEAGRLYIAVPPLYLVKRKGAARESAYAYTEEERQTMVRGWGGYDRVEVQRYKGLGEMNAEQLRETVFALPEAVTRQAGSSPRFDESNTLELADFVHRDLRVIIEDVRRTRSLIERLMGSAVAPRKEWLMATDWSEHVAEV